MADTDAQTAAQDRAWEEFLGTLTGGVRDPYAIRFDVIDMERAFQAGREARKGGSDG